MLNICFQKMELYDENHGHVDLEGELIKRQSKIRNAGVYSSESKRNLSNAISHQNVVLSSPDIILRERRDTLWETSVDYQKSI